MTANAQPKITLDSIKAHLAAGGTVQITTYTKSTTYTGPAFVDSFKVDSSGDLLVQRGKKWDCIKWARIDLRGNTRQPIATLPTQATANWRAALDAELLAPATNTEARQLAELYAEQPEAQPMPRAPRYAVGDTIRYGKLFGYVTATTDRDFIAIVDGYPHLFDYCDRETVPAGDDWPHWMAQPAAQLIDPIATLPLFSGTCPRVADPGRFDPPARRTDTQPTLF